MSSAKPIIPQLDMVFTISAAALASDYNFESTKGIIKKIIDKYGVDRISYSLVTYGDPPAVHLRFREKFKRDRLVKLIEALPKPSGEI